jgi:hypothetical protein
MSHTNSTTNYGLPQFLTSDKPAWLTDVNNAYSNIDSAIYAAQTKADTAYNDAGNAQSDATTAINDAAAADAKGSGAIASIEAAFDPTTIYSVGAKVMYNSLLYRCIVAVTTPGPWTGSDNWERITVDNLITSTNAMIGSLGSLSTADKSSIVNAVNEVNGKSAELPSEIRCGIGNYTGLKGGGHNNRVTVPITFSTPMTGTQYAVFIVISDAYADYPYVQGYCFSGSRTANGFKATIVSMSTDTVTANSGSFYWVAVRYK